MIGWYKIGAFTDKMLVSQNEVKIAPGNIWNNMDDVQADNSEVNFHIT